jgi:hypothetical protein
MLVAEHMGSSTQVLSVGSAPPNAGLVYMVMILVTEMVALWGHLFGASSDLHHSRDEQGGPVGVRGDEIVLSDGGTRQRGSL